MLIALTLALAVQAPADPITPDEVRAAGRLVDLAFDDDELELMLPGVEENRAAFRALRAEPLANSVLPALVFEPLLPGIEPSALPSGAPALAIAAAEAVRRPDDLADLVWADVPTLAGLVRARAVSSVELAELALTRLEALDPRLLCVVTPMRERALARAAELDRELADGRWRGPLHGIPYGAKDLFAVRGAPTTWGSALFREQRFDEDATAIARLEEAGAVLVAKLSLGELAWGDVWFGGTTKNPWNLEQGSSGSSAGSASAVVAGCVPFALGSETLGSVVSPSARCGATGLRPTFGRVSRHGAMTLSWSMDKVGVLARSVRDAALVLEVIHGPDGRDPTVHAFPFRAGEAADPRGWRVGFDQAAFADAGDAERAVLDDLRALGVELVPLTLPEAPLAALLTTLSVEAATAFDELTRSGDDERMVRQVEQAWPNALRTARTVPAVEYLRASRERTLLMHAVAQAFDGLDAVVHPSFAGGFLQTTNLTGQPCVAAPLGLREDGTPGSITFTGRLYGEERLCALVQAWQARTGHHLLHPDL
jgi:Asp-tRNA(Asn)/Glu-tRNA(Gln) amidotransferase A subunit family amidase